MLLGRGAEAATLRPRSPRARADQLPQGGSARGAGPQVSSSQGSASSQGQWSPGTDNTSNTRIRAFKRTDPAALLPVPPPPKPSGDRPARRARILVIGASVLAFLLIAGLAVVLIQQKRTANAAGDSGPLPSEVVQHYLNSIAAGDADKALRDLAEKPAKTDLMTDDVLAASAKAAPITDIKVTWTERTARSVKTSYTIGEKKVEANYPVVANGNGFRINGGYLAMDLSSLPAGLSYRMNGAALGRGEVALFPGSYTLSTSNPYLSLGKGATFIVKSPTESATPTPEPTISESGVKSVRALVSAEVSRCLKSDKLKAGCGLTVGGDGPNGSKADDGTISRSLSGSGSKQLAGLDVWIEPGKPSQARTVGLNIPVDTTATCVREKKIKKKSGKKKTKTIKKDCTLSGAGTSLADVTVDLSKSKPVLDWN